jgi:hypothetical protein
LLERRFFDSYVHFSEHFLPGGVRPNRLSREDEASVRKIGTTIVAIGVLGGATILAANLFPDQAYAVLQNVRAWASVPATRVGQNPPAPQGTSSPAKSQAMRFVLLPESKEGAVLRLCSRRGPKVDCTWKATEQDITTLESNLRRISSLRSTGSVKGISIAHPEDCYRQYIPVIVARRKLIYVNAFCGIEVPGWRTDFVTICDGGESVWGVLYDPTTGEFSDLEVNGIA